MVMRRLGVRLWFVAFVTLLAVVFTGCLPDPPHLSDVDSGAGDASDEPDVTMVGMNTPDAGGEDAPADAPGTTTPKEGGAGGGDAGEGGTGSCGPANCAGGCCDESGVCQLGTDQGACGMGGAKCAVCAVGTSCSGHACSCGGGGGACLGCCTGSGGCVTAGHDTCGANGAACSACGDGQECVNGACVCDPTSCPTGCCNGNTCVTTGQDATQCGAGGAACNTCSSTQACVSGACACTQASCPGGCCSGATCLDGTQQSGSACGSGGNACGTCATGQTCSGGACSCGGSSCNGCCANGACSTTPSTAACGLGGGVCATCAANQECSAQGKCVCDANSCPNGCCDANGVCQTSGVNTCGIGGAACVPCGSGQTCSSGGACTCTAASCPSGCCNGVSCVPYASEMVGTCGTSGAACGGCQPGQRCNTTNGACVCDGSSCPSGCCDTNGQCQTSNTNTCGTGGAACMTCGSGLTCSAGACTCTAASCSGGCCGGGACVAYANQNVNTCGASGATCGGCSLSEATAGCSTTNGTCTVASCAAGFGNCDGLASNGCETNTNTSTTYCGSCGTGHSCASGGSCNNGTCACPSGQTNCSNVCAALSSDPANCATCGHSCYGGSCGSGKCQSWVIAGPGVAGSPALIAADATYLYWVDAGLNEVLRIPVATPGASPTVLMSNSNLNTASNLKVTGSTLVITLNTNPNATFFNLDSELWTLSTTGTNQSPNILDTFTGSNYGQIDGDALAINTAGTTAYVGQVLYNATTGNVTGVSNVYACPLATKNACTILQSPQTQGLIGPVVSGTYLLWADFEGQKVARYTLPSGPLNASFVTGILPSPNTIAADATRTYFTANQDGTGTTFTVFSVLSAGSGSGTSGTPTGWQNTTNYPTTIASDGSYIYYSSVNYSSSTPTGTVQYSPVSGGGVTNLYSGSTPSNVVVANGVVFWIDGSSIYAMRFP
jgi:hypothetical protein